MGIARRSLGTASVVGSALALASLTVACKKTTAKAAPLNDGEIVFESSDYTSISFAAKGKTYDGGYRIHVAALALPSGPQTYEVTLANGRKVPVTLNRPMIAPSVTFEPPLADDRDRDVSCNGEFCTAEDSVLGMKGTTLVLQVNGPPLEIVEIAGQRVTTAGITMTGAREPPTKVTIDLRPLVTDAAIDEMSKDIELPVKITADSTREGVLRVEEAMKMVMWRVAEEVEKGPITFGADDVMPKNGPRSMLIVGDEHVGAPAKFRELDLIAVPHDEDRDAHRTCSGYGSGAASGTLSAPLHLLDSRVKVYERRTGKLVKEKLFVAPDECPSTVTAVDAIGPGGVKLKVAAPRAEKRADFGEVRKWLKTLLEGS